MHGIESANGIERLGIITLDSTCQPLNGVYQPVRWPDPDNGINPNPSGDEEKEDGDGGERVINNESDEEKVSEKEK